MIGISPNEASKITDPDIIKKVNDIKEEEFSKINMKRNYIINNSYGLLNPKFII